MTRAIYLLREARAALVLNADLTRVAAHGLAGQVVACGLTHRAVGASGLEHERL